MGYEESIYPALFIDPWIGAGGGRAAAHDAGILRRQRAGEHAGGQHEEGKQGDFHAVPAAADRVNLR